MQIWQSAFNTNNSSGHNAHFIKLWIVIVLDVYSCFIKAKATLTRLPFYWDYRHGKFDKILQKENGNCFHFGIYQVHFTTKSSDVSQHPNTHPKTKKKKLWNGGNVIKNREDLLLKRNLTKFILSFCQMTVHKSRVEVYFHFMGLEMKSLKSPLRRFSRFCTTKYIRFE